MLRTSDVPDLLAPHKGQAYGSVKTANARLSISLRIISEWATKGHYSNASAFVRTNPEQVVRDAMCVKGRLRISNFVWQLTRFPKL